MMTLGEWWPSAGGYGAITSSAACTTNKADDKRRLVKDRGDGRGRDQAYLSSGFYSRQTVCDAKPFSKVKQKPGSGGVCVQRFVRQQKHAIACSRVRRGVALQPQNATLHFNLGLAYDKLKRFDQFVKEVEEAIRLDPKYAEAMNYLGYSYAEKDMKLTEAMDLIKRALAIKPDDGAYVDSLGWTHFKLGQWDDAVRELERAVSLLPDDAVIHEHLGEAYLEEPSRARESWLRSLELDPTNAKLIERFKTTGFGDPESEERFQRAKSKKDAQEPAADNRGSAEPQSRNAKSGT
jgi:tetratricopeptide (TPR) repeat protein